MATKFRSFDDLPLVLRVEDLMPILDIGRNAAYELIRCGQIRSVRVGRQIRVPKDAVAEFLAGRKGMNRPGEDAPQTKRLRR